MSQEQLNGVRDFNRFYAKVIGLLDKTYLNSAYLLVEVRVMWEIMLHPNCTANDILQALGLDKHALCDCKRSASP
jgi:putative acetyltransferase